eukprot:gene8370-195_t
MSKKLSTNTRGLAFMKQGKEKKILEELSKETKTKESEEHWINPNFKKTYNVPNKVIIEDKNPSFLRINDSEAGRKTFGDVKKNKKMFEYSDKLNLKTTTSTRLTEVISDYPKNAKSLSDLVKSVLEKIPTNVEHKHTYQHDNYNLNYKCNGHFTYFCLTSDDFPLRVTFSFLDDLETNHMRTRTTQKNFSSLIKDKMAHFNNLDHDSISVLKKKVDDTKEVMLENIDKVISRGTDLDELVEKTESISVKSKKFSKDAKTLKIKTMYRNIVFVTFCIIFTIVLIAIGIFVLIWILCGFPDFYRCEKLFTKK